MIDKKIDIFATELCLNVTSEAARIIVEKCNKYSKKENLTSDEDEDLKILIFTNVGIHLLGAAIGRYEKCEWDKILSLTDQLLRNTAENFTNKKR